MSYIKTVTIMSNITNTYVSENVSTVYEAIANKIASVTGWTKEDIGTQIYVGNSSKQLRISISYLAGTSIFDYSIYSQNNNGDVNINTPFKDSVLNSSYKNLYLHYCKSKSGKTIGIGITSSGTPAIDFIIAEDANGDFAGIGLNDFSFNASTSQYASTMIWNGYKCKLSGVMGTSSYNYASLQPLIDPNVVTSICKLPNYISGCMFKELYLILSINTKVSNLNSVVLDIEGKKYQGCYSNNGTSISENYNPLAILAG